MVNRLSYITVQCITITYFSSLVRLRVDFRVYANVQQDDFDNSYLALSHRATAVIIFPHSILL